VKKSNFRYSWNVELDVEAEVFTNYIRYRPNVALRLGTAVWSTLNWMAAVELQLPLVMLILIGDFF
jgi:hypothetical protein